MAVPPDIGVRARVLICDDDALTRQIVIDRLEPEFECLAASGAEQALALAQAGSLDLVISDLLMPGANGLELCQRLRKLPGFDSVPVVVLSAAHADDAARASLLEAGADDFLLKPIGPRELLARVRSLVRMRRARRELEERTKQLEAVNDTLRAAQGVLVQTEKLATLGTLVAGIAHEINNPLAYMKSGSAQLEELAAEGEAGLDALASAVPAQLSRTLAGSREAMTEIRAVAREIAEGAARLARIAGDLKVFGTSAPTELEPIDLAQEARRAWSMASLQASRKPKLTLAEGAWPSVVAQNHQLGQVLLNIFVNAVHALEPKGESGEVKVWTTEEEEHVSLHIQDDGPGIPEEHLPRIFDPFFTTKPPGKGTGLGLSVSFGLVRAMGGLIEACSPAGEGAHFIIHLPKEPPPPDDYNATRLGRPPSRSVLRLVPRPPSGGSPARSRG